MKSGGWQLQKLSSTRYSEIVFYVLTVVLSYSLYHLFANTQAGTRFADKTRQALAFEQLRTQRTHIIVYAGGYFEIFETLSFVQMVLQLSPTCARATAHVAGRASQPNSEAGMTFPQRRRGQAHQYGEWPCATQRLCVTQPGMTQAASVIARTRVKIGRKVTWQSEIAFPALPQRCVSPDSVFDAGCAL